jgi:hypothetical protein
VITLNLVLGIILEIIKGANIAMEKLAPEQVQGAWGRHEERLEFWQGLVEWAKGKIND